NPRNQATVQDGRVIVQNVQGRQNRGQGNSARGAGAVGYGRAQNRVGNANPGQARQNPLRDLEWLGRVVQRITGSMILVFNVSNQPCDSDSICSDPVSA
ncbi:hypothetical protein Tco_1581130, partial [Tanacetum coccineum]